MFSLSLSFYSSLLLHQILHRHQSATHTFYNADVVLLYCYLYIHIEIYSMFLSSPLGLLFTYYLILIYSFFNNNKVAWYYIYYFE